MLHILFIITILIFIVFVIILICSMALFSDIMLTDLIFIIIVEINNMLAFKIAVFYQPLSYVNFKIIYQIYHKIHPPDSILMIYTSLTDYYEFFL